ncbi:MAG: DUF3883 domain-containing protein [Desulfobulbaceae bacterium]|jgi:hypothetical protein|nr:DUF3883 domain-containing protein [Desulfobulbaceae bacterium]
MAFEINYEEDLVPRICDLIDGYSKNSILKEYLQNADDSGATELVVTFDKRIHTSLIDTKFEVAKETSLLLYNNVSFKDKDFESIVKISAHGKIGDANSTGRFGQGFSSSFSISDHPSFVSSGTAYWFDVLRNAVAKGKNKSIQGWDLEKDNQEISQWLKAFNLDNSQSGTTFRLPLRNDKTANRSDISHEVFKYEDFLNWCDEWKDNTSGLLFLRHIQKLVLQEINGENEKIIHVEISTKNSNELLEYNNKIQDEFSSNLLEICENWKNNGKTLPLFTYKHHFLIKYFDRDKKTYHDFEKSWAVVNGLFRGEDDNLIDQAIRVLTISPNTRKVLPWAGVAVSLDEKGNVKKHNKSNYHTFLPLPVKSKHPVQIHGWFDLNPKRTEITYDGSGDDKNILIEWNRLLFKEGVGIAWAYLIDFIKKSCDSKRYYSLWPKNHDDDFDEYLLKGFYKEITKLKCFKTAYKKEEIRWNTPKDNIYFFQNNSDKKIFEAFKEHFSIISPKPTNNIIDGLRDIGTDLVEITPEFIRDYLYNESKELEFPFALGNMPIAMLSKKEWLLSILVFCAQADEDKDYTLLEGLPLELTRDNKVNCLAESKLLDSNPRLPIFKNDKSLFVNSEILEILKDAEELPSSWLVANLKNYLTVLQEHIDKYERKNKTWLKSLLSMITNADGNEISEAINELHELKVVYQYDGTFAQLKSDTDSPILITKEEILNIDYLAQTGMQLVHPEYVDIYRPLIKWNQYELITDLNSHALIKHLVSISEDEYEFFKDKDTREYLIDLLAQDISWIDVLGTNEKKWLNDMPFIATETGNIYAKSECKNLYLSAGFKPPKHIQNLKGEYEIISVVDDKQHAMYRKMGFEEQNPINYLKQIIIPFIESGPSVDDVRNISEWLANNWEKLTKDLEDDEEKELLSTLSVSQLVLDTGHHLNTAENYYHPDFFSNLPIFFQDKRYSPLKFEDKATQKNWSDFLSKLGASTEFIPEHIVTTIQSIAEEENDKKAIAFLNYISNHFEWFDEMNYEDMNIFKYLSDLAWIPVGKPKSAFLVPEDEYKKLRKPSELILQNDFKIAGGAHYIFSFKVNLGKKDEDGEFTEKDIAEKLGLLVKLPSDSVFDSFRRLRSINSQQIGEKNILDYSKEFYKYLGRSHIPDEGIPKDIKEKSVFIKGHWLPSSKVFQTSISLTGIFSWDELIVYDGKESKLAEGLIKLGVLAQPDNEYLVNYLCYLPQNQKLDKQQLTDAKAILNQFQNNLEELNIDDIPLLSRSDQLIPSDAMYIKDLPAYDKSDQKNDQLDFCQRQFETIARHCGVVSLAEKITPKLDTDRNKNSEEYNNNSWDDYIRSEPFKSAVLRLIYHEGRVSEDEIKQESLNTILPSQILLMDSLVVIYFIDDTWIYDDIGTPTYQDTENSILYLLNQDDDEDMCESIAKFISDSSDLNRDSFSLIHRILRHKFDTFEEIHNLLDKKNIKSLPEKIEIYEDVSLYDNNSVTEKLGIDEESPLNHNSEDDQSSLHENHSSKEGDTQSDTNTSSGKQREAQAGVEIPPPIKPKKSNPSNKEDDASSRGDHNRHGHNANQRSQKGGGTNRSGEAKSSVSNISKLNSNANSKIVSSNDRKPVYVGKDKEVDPNEQREQKERATEIGNRGEDYVLESSTNYLLYKSNKFKKAPTNNKGYDILEIDSNGDIVRYIEVKTLTGGWGEGGVAVTESQLEFAQGYDNWWLFVVENINTQNTTVHIFENPVQQANRFMFDHSWKQLAETAKKNQSVAPKEGDKYRLSDGIYEVSSIKPKGKFYKLILKETQTGKEVAKKFDPSWEKC